MFLGKLKTGLLAQHLTYLHMHLNMSAWSESAQALAASFLPGAALTPATRLSA